MLGILPHGTWPTMLQETKPHGEITAGVLQLSSQAVVSINYQSCAWAVLVVQPADLSEDSSHNCKKDPEKKLPSRVQLAHRTLDNNGQ